MVYKFSWSGISRPVSAQVVGEHLMELEERNGAVTSDDLLESARPEDSPVHNLFEWDDEKAAHQYRKQQANQVITSIRVQRIEDDGTESKVTRHFVNVGVRQSGKSVYVNVRKAMENYESRKTVLDDALRELTWFRQKYAELSELAKVFAAIDDLEVAG